MKAIIAVNNQNYIGKEGKIMWECPKDLAYFKEMTTGCVLLCGHNTYYHMPPLSDRIVIVDYRGDKLMKDKFDWCIGGRKTYEKYCHLFTELHISFINNDDTGDTMMPELKNLNPECEIITHYFGY